MGWVKFKVMKATARRIVKCKCRKTATRSKTFEFTVNPFNKNEDGSVKNADEVQRQAQEQADKWQPPAYVCTKCGEPAKGASA
jgi:hypothetical protein